MTSENINLALLILTIIICITVFIIAYNLSASNIVNSELNKAILIQVDQLSKNGYYDTLNKTLVSKGFAFRTKSKITPFQFHVFQILLGIATGVLATVLVSFILFPICFFIFYNLPIYMVKSNNKNFNKNAFNDIEIIFNVFIIYIKAGVYITDTIYECSTLVKSKRLSKALEEMFLEITSMNDMEKAVNNFKRKFDNEYVELFSMALLQFLETGNSAKIIEDSISQMDMLYESRFMQKEERAKNVTLLIQVLVFLGIMLIIFFIAAISMANITKGFL